MPTSRRFPTTLPRAAGARYRALVADLSQAAIWHRQVAALAAAADRAGVATADLPVVRARLLAQQSRLTEAAARKGAPLPALVPSPSEIATAGAALGDLTEPAVARTVRTVMSTLDAVDSALGVPTPMLTPVGPPPVTPPMPPPPPPVPGQPVPGQPVPGQPVPGQPIPVGPRWTGPAGPHGTALVERAGQRPALRNAAIYGGFAITVLAVQVGLFVVLNESQLPLSAPICLLVLPAFAWLGGFITIGVLFRSPPGEKPVVRSPRLGAVICALPDLLLCAGAAALFIANKVSA